MSDILRKFENRLSAELELSLAEVAFWNDLVARGKVKPEDVAGYVDNENRLIATKRYLLGL
jgi:hypothetical protein